MKILVTKANQYKTGEKASGFPNDFVRDIVYKDSVWTVKFASGEFLSFMAHCVFSYYEFHEDNNGNGERLFGIKK